MVGHGEPDGLPELLNAAAQRPGSLEPRHAFGRGLAVGVCADLGLQRRQGVFAPDVVQLLRAELEELQAWTRGISGADCARTSRTLDMINPLCDVPSGCCFFTRPWTVTRSSLRMLRRVAAFCRPLRPVLLLVSFLPLQSAVVGVLGLCWMWRDAPFARPPPPSPPEGHQCNSGRVS